MNAKKWSAILICCAFSLLLGCKPQEGELFMERPKQEINASADRQGVVSMPGMEIDGFSKISDLNVETLPRELKRKEPLIRYAQAVQAFGFDPSKNKFYEEKTVEYTGTSFREYIESNPYIGYTPVQDIKAKETVSYDREKAVEADYTQLEGAYPILLEGYAYANNEMIVYANQETGYRTGIYDDFFMKEDMESIGLDIDQSFMLAKAFLSGFPEEYLQNDDFDQSCFLLRSGQEGWRDDKQFRQGTREMKSHVFTFRHLHKSGAAIETVPWERSMEGIRVSVTKGGINQALVGWHSFEESTDQIAPMRLEDALSAVARSFEGETMRLILAEAVYFNGVAPDMTSDTFTPQWKILTDLHCCYVSMETGEVFIDDLFELQRRDEENSQAAAGVERLETPNPLPEKEQS